MMAVCTPMCKFVSEYAKIGIARQKDRGATYNMCDKNEMRVVAAQIFTFLIREIYKNECEGVRCSRE